jgi:putative membrane protein
MEAFKAFMAELAGLKGKKGVLISVIAVLLVPVVYAAILLSPTWSPYDNLSNLPVAVVNKDTGATSNGEPINVGKDIVEDFKKSKNLGWKFVGEKDAQKGLENLDYYMVIEIPEDFSKNITTVLDSEPNKPELKYIQNEGLNFLASQVTNNATIQIREQLGNKVTETYVRNVFAQLEDIPNGFKTAADGSEQIYSGTTELKEGTGQLLGALTEKAGDIDKLANGSKELYAGAGTLLQSVNSKTSDISTLANGAKTLETGLTTLKGGTGEILTGLKSAQAGLNGAMDKLRPGSQTVAAGMTQLSNGADGLSAGMKDLSANLKAFLAHPALAQNADFQKLVGASEVISTKTAELAASTNQLEAGAAQIAGGISQLSTGDKSLVTGLNKLVVGQEKVNAGAVSASAGSSQIANGVAQVETGWRALSSGATKLHSGSQQISDGNAAVKTGWATLTDGVTQVDAGVGKLNDGSKELANGLKDGAEQASSLKVGDKNIEMFSSPVELAGSKVNEYQYYRDSTAPYILSLALFVGILIMTFVVDFKKPAEIRSGFSWFVGKFLNLGMFAVIQALVVSIFALLVLQLQVGNAFAFILFAVFVSLVFLAIILFLVGLAGNIGRFLALIFIVLQLSTTGSNLPIEMLPDNLRALSQYLPLTYSNAGFKSIISLDNASFAWSNTGVLAIYLAIFVVLAAVVFATKGRSQSAEYDVAQ